MISGRRPRETEQLPGCEATCEEFLPMCAYVEASRRHRLIAAIPCELDRARLAERCEWPVAVQTTAARLLCWELASVGARLAALCTRGRVWGSDGPVAEPCCSPRMWCACGCTERAILGLGDKHVSQNMARSVTAPTTPKPLSLYGCLSRVGL